MPKVTKSISRCQTKFIFPNQANVLLQQKKGQVNDMGDKTAKTRDACKNMKGGACEGSFTFATAYDTRPTGRKILNLVREQSLKRFLLTLETCGGQHVLLR